MWSRIELKLQLDIPGSLFVICVVIRAGDACFAGLFCLEIQVGHTFSSAFIAALTSRACSSALFFYRFVALDLFCTSLKGGGCSEHGEPDGVQLASWFRPLLRGACPAYCEWILSFILCSEFNHQKTVLG
jgi:hypothetical protein